MKRSLIISLFLLICDWSQAQPIKVTNYYDQEKSHIKEEFFVKDSLSFEPNGPYTSYYFSGGKKSLGKFKYGNPVGFWRYFYETGNLKMSGEIRNGSNYGFWSYYYKSSSPRMSGNLFQGLRQG